MRGLKFLVIFMGILILVGTSFLIFTIIKRGSDMAISQKSIKDTSPLEINSPNNMKLNSVTYEDQNIILKFENNENYIIQIINIYTGKILKQINIVKYKDFIYTN